MDEMQKLDVLLSRLKVALLIERNHSIAWNAKKSGTGRTDDEIIGWCNAHKAVDDIIKELIPVREGKDFDAFGF